MNTRRVTIAQGWFAGAIAIAIALVVAVTSHAFDDTVSQKAAQFRDNMRKQLDAVEGRLRSVKATLGPSRRMLRKLCGEA